ncbi:MAG: ferrous iron transporter B [Proteobacteria bacterium]|nr:MAG: ferrous iron transporter B [Pseudomonadota bacterium]
MDTTTQTTTIPLHHPLLRGDQRLRIALVGLPKSGKSTIFQAVSSTSIYRGELLGTRKDFSESRVQIGLDEASVVDLPSIDALHHLPEEDRVTLKHLLWGDRRPPVSSHEGGEPPAPFAPPQVLIQVVDATALQPSLELTLELSLLGRPLVIALNRLDEARRKGLFINADTLSQQLGVPVIPTVAHMGKGIAALFEAAVAAYRNQVCPLPEPASPHLQIALQPLGRTLARPALHKAFRVPQSLLLMQLAVGDDYFQDELLAHFPQVIPEIAAACVAAEEHLPRPLADELHADRHHRAATLYEAATRLGGSADDRRWKRWLDELFLHPRWGLVGSLAVFALVLYVVFEVSAVLDSWSVGPLTAWADQWQPQSTTGVIGRAVIDGLIGLVGIVVPYMIPLVMLLVALEESGIMQRIAFVVDRGFHHIGLHGGVAVPFLLGLGCNVPAISAAARMGQGRERVVAALLITFVPCSARSAVILAIGGKYLGGLGVFAIFAMTLVVIAVLGRVLSPRFGDAMPGLIQNIPAYRLPRFRSLTAQTWERTSDILTIVTPLLVGGSVVLALLSHAGADATINTLLMPITDWWLGLPVVLGVPILFGILRKELSLLMVYQALGTFEIGPLLSDVQILTFLLFLTFYVPCISTFAVMMKSLGQREAFYSVTLSVGVALVIAGVARALMETAAWVTGGWL